MRALLVASLIVLAFGCSKDGDKKAKSEPATPAVQSTTGSDGLRHIPVEASVEGFVPDRIPGKPGEKIVLVVTRTTEKDCLAQFVTPDNKTIQLTVGKATEIAVTVPQTGEVGFACGMDMFHGVIVASPKS